MKPVLLTIAPLGDAVGVLLPQEMLDHLNVQMGDTLCFFATPTGYALTPTPTQPERDPVLETARRVMQENRIALHRLAGHGADQ